MSKLHGEEGEDRIGRGELRNPGDRADQPGQRSELTPASESSQRGTQGDYVLEPGFGPGESQK